MSGDEGNHQHGLARVSGRMDVGCNELDHSHDRACDVCGMRYLCEVRHPLRLHCQRSLIVLLGGKLGMELGAGRSSSGGGLSERQSG